MSEYKSGISKTQFGIYMESISSKDRTTYNYPFVFTLKDDVDLDRFVSCFNELFIIHPALDSRFESAKDGSITLVGNIGNRVEVINISEDEFNKVRQNLVVPFDYEKDNLARIRVYVTEKNRYLFVDVNHIVSDGSSYQIMFTDLFKLYAGEDIEGEEKNVFDIAIEEENLRKTDAFTKAKSYYENLLDGYDTDSTPVRDRYDDIPVQKWFNKEFEIDADKLKERRNKANASTSAILVSALGFTVAKYNYQKSSVISTIYTGRNDDSVKNTFAMMVKTFPFVTDFEKYKDVDSLLGAANSQLVDSRNNTLFSFADAVSEFEINNDINFAYHGKSIGGVLNNKLNNVFATEERIYEDKHIEDTKLLFEISDLAPGKYRLHVGYRNDVYSDKFANDISDAFISVIEAFVNGEALDKISLIDDEKTSLLDSCNNTDCEYDTKNTVVDLFRETAKEYKDQKAVVYEDVSITYEQLDELTDALAYMLKEKGIEAEKTVAVLIPRCEYMTVAAMGVLKAGGAYVPLDPTYPEERLNFMVEDSKSQILITTNELSGIITSDFSGERILIEDIKNIDVNIGEDKKNYLLENAPKPQDRFIMLYTSGTTGLPKGVIIEHRNLMAYSAWERKLYKLDTTSRIAAYASFGFDANMHDMYPALTSGATIHIISEDIRLDLPKVFAYFKDNEITHTLMTTQIGRQFASMGNPGSLKIMSTGGEKLASIDPPDYDLYNAYGPTECTIISTVKLLDKKYHDIPIGKMLDNLKGYIVDTDGNRLPIGAAGELWISGPQVAREYLNRPDKTQESFISNPFSNDEKYSRCYRTGDVVRFLEDGDIQFIGRRDGQVKVHGFRIELVEVEEVIRRFEGVKDVTCVAFDDPATGKYICAYVVSENELNVQAMNEFIMNEKPLYMVPAITMQIDAIPYNQNQKVNKRALPKPERKLEDIVLPENDTQQRIYDVISSILGHSEFGIDTDIKLAGIDSIGVVQVNTNLYKEFGVSLSISDIFENGTVRKLEGLLGTDKEELEILSDYPLTKTQMGVFTECMAHPDSTIYNIPLVYSIDKSIDIDKLKNAICDAVNAHKYVMTKLFTNDKSEVRIIREDCVFDINMIEEIDSELSDVLDSIVVPYELIGGRLFRIAIIKGSENYLFVDFHHIISDGTSLNILIEDISKAYAGETIESEKFTGFEVSLLESKNLNSDKYQKAKEFYASFLTDSETDCLPPKVVDKDEEISCLKEIDTGVSSDNLKQFCESNSISMSTLFNASFGYVLSRYTYKEDVLYTTVYNGRSDSRMNRIMSMLVKTFPVRCEINGNDNVIDYIKKIGDQMFGSMANDIYSFSEISREYNVDADILFTYQGDMFSFDTLCGKPCKSVTLSLDEVKAPIDIDVVLKEGKVSFVCNFRGDMYDEKFIENLVLSTLKTANEFTVKTKLNEVSILTKEMSEKITSFNDTYFPVQYDSVNKMFERQVSLHPDRKAVVAAGETLTYDQLNRLSNRAAHSLISKGIKKDEIIGLIAPRTKEVFIGEEAILKAGGAFLPMVPEYPDSRIDFCLTDASSRYVVTTQKIKNEREELFKDKPYEVLTFEELLLCENEENPNLSIDMDSLAYCIYTSGSTGTPKGVAIEHKNLRNFLDPNEKNAETNNYIKYGHTILSVISISFDFSLMEIQLPICNGLTVCMASEEMIHDPLALAKMIEENNVDVMSCTPSFIGNMIDIEQVANALGGMKLFDFGAEAFPPKLLKKLRVTCKDAVICNGYGPTEATISCVSKIVEDNEKITIGKPAANVRVYVCDKDMNVLPPCACGELVIGGDGVGRGYIELPEKTREVFVELGGERVYRSGDVVRYLENGEIEFFGRLDNQVKLRGFRVELDEIENNINTFDGIKVSKVVVRNNGSEDYLAAFFTADKEIDIKEITTHLKEHLTYYMVPAVLMQLDNMPLTVNGKIDKKKLPDVEFSVVRDYVEPKEGLEKEICEIYQDILGQEKVGATDSFFEIGGTSLTATIAVIKLTDKGYKIVYKDIFDNPSPRELVNLLEGNRDEKIFKDDFNYAKIDSIISHNTMQYVDDFTTRELGNIVLTGASGFLGIHILKQFLDTEEGIAYCLIRKGRYDTPLLRLQNMMMYYFGVRMNKNMIERIVCIDGDITNVDDVKKIESIDATTVINCAALVKHFVSDDSLDRINVYGVENLIDVCAASNKRLIQISTTSVGGMLKKENKDIEIDESKLFFDQIINNDYVRTKFLAERAVLSARAEGKLDGIIVRVGNLMSRNSDGEFQINFITNGFMRNLKAYKQLKAFPITAMHGFAEFSPIDSTAAAILKFATVVGDFCIYHCDNSHLTYMSDVISSMKHYGFDIDVVSEDRFMEIVKESMNDDKMRDAMLGLMAYDTADEEPLYLTGANNRFSVEVLYRLGYLWPITDNRYLDNVISVLDGFDFFELDK